MSPILTLDRERCLVLQDSLRREWLEPDGLGGFASSTVLLCPTRRYHGLLVARIPGSAKRHAFLSRFEEHVVGAEREFALSMGRYPATFHPQGHLALDRFEMRPWPAWRYRIGDVLLEREILVVRGTPTVLCRYQATHPHQGLALRLRPLVSFREADALTHENLDLDPRVRRTPTGVVLQPYGALPALSLTVGGVSQTFEADPVWFRRIEYWRDILRGYDAHEDNFSPGWFNVPLPADVPIVVAATIGEAVADPVRLWEREAARRRAAAPRGPASLEELLDLSADDFLFRDPDGRLGVIAGYPWFGEWGRDTFIAIPGLTLWRDRVETCGEVLEGALRFLSDGRLPNVFGTDAATSAYPAADTAVWFAWAVAQYAQAGGDRDRVDSVLLPAVEDLLENLASREQDGLRVGDDGLLWTREGGGSLTWMDARVDGVPVTPRYGAAVEVNALWHAALGWLEKRHRQAGRPARARAWRALERRAGRALAERFWLGDGGGVADVVTPDGPDASVRPNMLVLAALPGSPLSPAQRLRVVERVERELLTPVGLRTLSPQDARYVGRYTGSVEARDRAYHQGTVWPWLLGFYVEACLRARGRKPAEKRRLGSILANFEEKHRQRGLLHVSEVYDGDPPYAAGGSTAQAWSTSELLRAFALLEGRCR